MKNNPTQLLDSNHLLLDAMKRPHIGGVHALLKGEENILIYGSSDGTIRFWDVKKKKQIAVLKGHSDLVISLLRVSEKVIVSGSSDGTIRLWNVEKGKEILKIERENRALSYGKPYLFFADNYGDIFSYDLSDMEAIKEVSFFIRHDQW